MPKGLSFSNIPVSLHRQFSRKARDYYLRAYDNDGEFGVDAIQAQVMVRAQKVYRSHRGVPPHERDGYAAKKRPWEKKKALMAAGAAAIVVE